MKTHLKAGDDTKIFNPRTNKYVNIDGVIGRKVIEEFGYPSQAGGYGRKGKKHQVSQFGGTNDRVNNNNHRIDLLIDQIESEYEQGTLNSRSPAVDELSELLFTPEARSYIQDTLHSWANTYPDLFRHFQRVIEGQTDSYDESIGVQAMEY